MTTPVFIDLPIPEQVQELRGYLKGLGGEISEDTAEADILKDLKNVIEASTICWTESNNETDVEMVFNSITSLILVLPSEEIAEPVALFCEKVGKQPKGDKRAALRVKCMSNLFYGLDDGCSLRADVYVSMINLAHKSDNVHLLNTDLDAIKKWISKWDISTKKLQNLLRSLHDALIESKLSENATKVMLELLGTYTEDNASQARDDAHRCIVTHLGDPSTFLMDHLLSLKPVKFLEGELIHDLLTIFVSGKISQYQQFYKNNTDFINTLGLSHEQNMRKMRLLTFMQMAETRQEIEYSLLEEEMLLKTEEIEDFIIDVLRTKAVRAKIDQMQRKVVISSTTHRTFGRQQWQVLKQHLIQWQENLKQVQAGLSNLEMYSAQASTQ